MHACRRQAKLEAEAQAREAEIQAFQRQHWQEMKGAAARNRAALLVRSGTWDGSAGHEHGQWGDVQTAGACHGDRGSCACEPGRHARVLRTHA